jgi:hypothetical protein
MLPRALPPRRTPLAPDDLALQKAFNDGDLDDEIEDLIQTIASSQGLDAIMNVIDSLISTIEYQEIIIWSLAKLLEEKGLITKEELLKKVSELNRRRLVYSDHED